MILYYIIIIIIIIIIVYYKFENFGITCPDGRTLQDNQCIQPPVACKRHNNGMQDTGLKMVECVEQDLFNNAQIIKCPAGYGLAVDKCIKGGTCKFVMDDNQVGQPQCEPLDIVPLLKYSCKGNSVYVDGECVTPDKCTHTWGGYNNSVVIDTKCEREKSAPIIEKVKCNNNDKFDFEKNKCVGCTIVLGGWNNTVASTICGYNPIVY